MFDEVGKYVHVPTVTESDIGWQAPQSPKVRTAPHKLAVMRHPDFAERFRARLRKRSLSTKQTDLAKLLSCSSTTAWNYLNGAKLPSMEHAIEMAQLLGCSVEWLLTGRGPEEPGINQPADEEESALINLIRSMPRHRRQALIALFGADT